MFYPFIRISVIFIILSLLHLCVLCPYFQCLVDKLELESNTSAINLPTDTENHHLPNTACSHKERLKVIINPYQDIVECVTSENMFKSGYLRCAACLAVAQEIEESIEEIEIGDLGPNEEIENIDNILKSVCMNGFQEFDLRNYKGNAILMKPTSSSSHISSKMNGQWQSKLREICSKYLEHINVIMFYSMLLQTSYDIEEYLCRGDGVFRDCYNIYFEDCSTVEEECQLEIPDIRFMVKFT